MTTSITNETLDPDEPANPCGIIAYTVFNDTFFIPGVFIHPFGIGWPGDVFKYQITDPSKMWINTTEPRFQNWMRIAALPNFRKLWGRVEEGIAAGNYTVTITNRNF